MQLFLSLINIIMGEKGSPNARMGTMGLSMGVIWGDNLTPFGDTILALTIAQKHGVRINPASFAKIGTTTTFLQLIAVSLVIITIFNPIFIIVDIIVVLVASVIINKINKKPIEEDPETPEDDED